MIRSLCGVIGLGCFGLIVLFLFSDKTISYGSLAFQQIVVFEKEKVLIYGATKYFGSPMFDSNAVKNWCSAETASWCTYTNDEKLSSEADAWLYHNRDYSPRIMKKWDSKRVHVMFTQESPIHETIRFPPNTVNWTMTYRRDSEVYWPYGYIKMQMFNTKQNNDTIWKMKKPSLTAAWLVSNCKTGNKRMELIQKAQKLSLAVDIYGSCFDKKIPGCGRYAEGGRFCAAMQLKNYYFYFSFENSNCDDYVTEKFYNALQYFFAVPIVIKRSIYENMGFPSKSFIALDDFASIQDMVVFLDALKENKTEYLSYHDWRNDYEVTGGRDEIGICALCRRLRTPFIRPRSYSNLAKWFSKSTCDNNYAFKYLK